MSLLELQSINSGYGHFQALFEVNLSINEGETHAIIGANGAGKSTLLRTICGLIKTEPADKVRFDGQPIGQMSPHKRVGLGISYVPEGRWVFPSLTVNENLQVGAHSRRKGTWDMDRVYDLFPLLARLKQRQAFSLSGGEQQALSIARGLMSNPRLLLLDEVSLGLAPVVVEKIYQAMPAIVGSGTTLLLVEQDVGQAMKFADRVTCMLEGRLVLEGAPGEISQEAIFAAYFGV
jgi:branched-chain amino acid transport system ATP-binding protein